MSEYNIQMNKYNALNAGYDQLFPATKIKNVDGLNEALQNKAPAGYGLGTNPPSVTDFNDAKLPGWYSGDPAVNYPSKIQYGGYGMVFVQGFRNNMIIQRWMWQHNSFLPQLTEAIRYYNPDNKLWSEWEYINPPMELGVEYRTTERYLGKPVYVKVIQAGFNPAGTTKTTSDTDASASDIVRFSAENGGWTFPTFMYGGNYGDNGNIQLSVRATSGGIYVSTFSKSRDMTSVTLNVSVYYTKD